MKLFKLMNAVLLLCVSANISAAEWSVDNEHSQLNFISVKKGSVAEIHQFTNLKGDLDSSGAFLLSIDLASVDTHNPIRDERMKKFLFNTELYPHAQLSANVDKALVDGLAEGTAKKISISSSLLLHGIEKAIVIDVIVTKLTEDKLIVSSAQPVIIQAKDFSLAAGLDKLRELASLPSISQVVPVSFYVTLNLKQ